MWRDFRFALRLLAAKPAFTLIAAFSLALGIGANSAIFSVIDGMWFRPPGVATAGKLVRVFSVSREDSEGLLSYPEYLDFKAQVPAFEDVVAIGGRGATLVEGDNRQLETLNLVSPNFFPALGVQAQIGRLFSREDAANAPASVVLGNAFWKRHYGGDPTIVGKQIHIQRGGDLLVTVIGVLPASFREVDTGGDRDLWFEESSWAQIGDPEELRARGYRWFEVLGVLAPAASLDAASVQVKTAAERMSAQYPQTDAERSAMAMSDLHFRLKSAGTNGLALLAIVVLVVIISCVNVANLLLSRGASRSTEIAIRLSMGAHRSRLVRQLMMENVVLGMAGVALGMVVGSAIVRMLPSLILAPPGFFNTLEFRFDDRVFLFSLIVSLLTIFLFGIVPAIKASQTDLVPALKSETTPIRAGRRWPLRNWHALVQIAISLTLLACAGAVVHSFANTRTEDLGFGRKQLLNVWLAFDAKPELYRAVIARFQRLPGVKSVAAAVRAPLSLSSNGMAQLVRMPGQAASSSPYEIKYNSVTANFLATMGTPVLRGRGFDSSDEGSSSNSAIINQYMAERYWPNEDPIGKTFTTGVEHPRLRQVIGVVKNAPINDIGEAPEPYIYLPYWSNFEQEATFMIETNANAAELVDAARKALKSVDSRLDPLTIVTEADLIRFSAQRYQLTAALVSALGALGLLLTIVGVYGVVSYGVSLRTREFGIRMALGADRRTTMGQVLREIAYLGVVGSAVGMPAALIAVRSMRSLLFGVSPWSVTGYLGAILILAASLFVAGALPARRAMRIDPAKALRMM